jgi:tetratricopeptide (TPR) repeat protein
VAGDQTHSKLLTQAAREILAPEGIFQKGRSRTWIDDRGWWIVVIEFQPSSWSKGSYLNVGAMWLWYEKDHFSFDAGDHRIERFVKYVDQAQFALEAGRLAGTALTEAIKLRERFASIPLTAGYLLRHTADGNPWTFLHAGVALGCMGRVYRARACFKKIERLKTEFEWQSELQDKARQFGAALGDRTEFLERVRATIVRTRRLLGLPQRHDLGV